MDKLWVLPKMAKKLKARAYPLARVRALRGRNYFCSSIAYMIAHAILLEPEEIGLWGVDLAEDGEYVTQRPNVEWWLGFAEGRGIKVTVAKESALLKAAYVYGQERPTSEADLYHPDSEYRTYLDHQVTLCKAGLERFKYDERNFLKMKGGKEAFQAALTTLDCFERGAKVERYGEIKIPENTPLTHH